MKTPPSPTKQSCYLPYLPYLLGFFLSASITTQAQSFYYVDDTVVGGGNNGSSWADAYATLQDALATATAGDVICVAEGIYYPDEGGSRTNGDRSSTFQLVENVALFGGYPNGGSSTFVDRDPTAHPTILSGDLAQNDGPNFFNNADNAHNVLQADSTITPATVMEGFTITAGNANGSSPDNRGGGAHFDGASPTLNRCSFPGNSAIYGGGIFNENNSSPKLTNCSISVNHASVTGGGMYNSNSSPELLNCSFSGNSVVSHGGGIYSSTSSSPELTNCHFSGNDAGDHGGGIYNNSASATLTNCTLSGNDAGTHGGGIYNNASSSAALTNCIIWNNRDSSGSTSANSSNYGSGTGYSYSYCLVQGRNLTSSNGMDGSFLINDPDFQIEVNPASAPTTSGDLNLIGGSPAIDAGINSANSASTDIDGNVRILGGTIDLGAYERVKTIYVDASAVGADNGTTWNHAYLKLQDALEEALAGDVIWVAEGSYYPDEGAMETNNDRSSSFTLIDDVRIYGGFPDDGSATLVTDRDPATNPTILSGDLRQNDGPNFSRNSDNAYNVVEGANPITDATILDGFTITAGNANGPTSKTKAGGGLHLSNTTLTLTNCSFIANKAENAGGGFYYAISSPIVTNCSFIGNSANTGGGIHSANSAATLTNCCVSGNRASNEGGGINNAGGSGSILINCTLSGNDAGTHGGGVENPASMTLTNCVIWNNRDGSGTGTANSAIHNSGPLTHSRNLVQGYNLIPFGGLNGTSPTNDPDFLISVDPATAPTSGGDLRLAGGSPAIDEGDDTANGEATDLAGDLRIQNGTIDLGAYEGSFSAPLVTFAGLHPALDPDDDENQNGISNYADYAAGGDPTAPDDPSLRPQIHGRQVTFSYRNNAADVFAQFKKSDDLQTWSELIETIDYAASPQEAGHGSQTLITLDLLTTDLTLFFRGEFSTTAP